MNEPQQQAKPFDEDGCSSAPRVNSPSFDSPCYNGGSCVSGLATAHRNQQQHFGSTNYSCICPPGFTGPLCEINIDDCLDHQCQNGGMCVDGVNSYRCICRDPTTTGEFCEQLNSFAANSLSNSIGPIALPMVAASSNVLVTDQSATPPQQQQQQQHQRQENRQQQISARSADMSPIDLSGSNCKRVTQKRHYEDGNGCHSVRVLKISECAGSCGTNGVSDCCLPAKVKRRRVRMQCNDGASYVKTIDLVKKCACSNECASNSLSQFNATQEDTLLQITRLDAVD